jgi:hypothetical protein
VASWSQDLAVFKQALGSIQRVSAQIIDGLNQLLPTVRLAVESPSFEPALVAPQPAQLPEGSPWLAEGAQDRLF